jgi:hypothetical protein
MVTFLLQKNGSFRTKIHYFSYFIKINGCCNGIQWLPNLQFCNMKVILKYLVYSIVIVALTVGCLMIFKNHPEVQLAFVMPGLFIVAYSLIRDDIYQRNAHLFVRSGFRER